MKDPLRTVPFELTLINNLLYVCSKDVSSKGDMEDALDLIKTALEDLDVLHVAVPSFYYT